MHTFNPTSTGLNRLNATPAPACSFDAPHSDASDWNLAGQAWREQRASEDGGLRACRIRLVNGVLGAMKRFERGGVDADDLAESLHRAVRAFNERAA